MTNKEIIEQFYTSFSQGDAKDMIECYHQDITFTDPVFGCLKGDRAVNMWKMLLSNKKTAASIQFSNIETNSDQGSANWIATYAYGPKKRNVINKVTAHFKFKDGKIIEHTDNFDLWEWTKQAMGVPGYLLGWTAFMKNKIQKTTNSNLKAFMNKNV